MSFALRDPIHDYIRVDDLEAAVLQSRPLQRLRFVRQLGLANLVFPGAEHSRFGHVLGAMELAGRVYDALAEKTPDVLENHPQAMDRRKVRLAALLHDIGHAAFSHSAEELFEGGIEHEQMTSLLLQLPELTSLLDVEIGTESIAGILSGEGGSTDRLLSQIVSGDLDADKMDYLLRDSHYCGVRYGNYDLGRLLETIEPLQDPETGTWGIGIDEGGVHAFEALVLARYYMFSQVYFNVTSKVLELHLNEWLERSGVRWPADPLEFLEHDDHSVWWKMRQSDDLHARAILNRDHYFLAFETKEHLNESERRAFTALLDELRSSIGETELLVSNSAKDPHRLDEAGILVKGTGGELRPMQDVSHFIRHLTRIDRFRVYVHKDRCSHVGQLFRERWS